MKQHYIRAVDFCPEGETGESDAYIDPNDLKMLKKQSGMTGLLDSSSVDLPIPANWVSSTNKGQIMKEQNIKPGTKAWFKLWFGDKR